MKSEREQAQKSIAENRKLLALIDQHEANTRQKVETAVADHKYGTIENYVACQQRGITTYMGDAASRQNNARCQGIFPDTAFLYDAESDTYRCPAGETLRPRAWHRIRRTKEYIAAKGVCAACPLRAQCTRASYGRTVKRHEHQEALNRARQQAHSPAARRARRRRQHLAEVSFADATNNHHFKRARWRRLWRQQIQDHLIAAIQNVRILLRRGRRKPESIAVAQAIEMTLQLAAGRVSRFLHSDSAFQPVQLTKARDLRCFQRQHLPGTHPGKFALPLLVGRLSNTPSTCNN